MLYDCDEVDVGVGDLIIILYTSGHGIALEICDDEIICLMNDFTINIASKSLVLLWDKSGI